MKVSELKEGERVLMLMEDAIRPAWKPCRILAVSSLGYAIETEDDEFGPTPRWFDLLGKGAHLRFRQFYEFNLHWRDAENGGEFEMITLANQTATGIGYLPTAVYKDLATGEVLSCPAEVFYERFTPVHDKGITPQNETGVAH